MEKKPITEVDALTEEPTVNEVKIADEIQIGDELAKGGPKVIYSPLPNFSRKEFIVLKHNVFTIQSITSKKLVLRVKGQNKKLPDGVYVIQ